ncbi:MAG: nucleotidyltransferase [Planctomycetota bacterium]
MKSLNAHKVRYVIIGATAFPPHGYARATQDIDIFIEPTESNALKTRQALKSFGYDILDLSLKDLLTKKVLIRQYIVETDIHPFVKGVDFKKIWRNKISDKIGSTSVYFAGLEDLIRMKKAAGRAKDKEDLKILIRLKAKLNRKNNIC